MWKKSYNVYHVCRVATFRLKGSGWLNVGISGKRNAILNVVSDDHIQIQSDGSMTIIFIDVGEE